MKILPQLTQRQCKQFTTQDLSERLDLEITYTKSMLQDKESRVHQDIYGISNCGMENEQVYCGLDELEQAKGYLTTVIVKEHVVQ